MKRIIINYGTAIQAYVRKLVSRNALLVDTSGQCQQNPSSAVGFELV